MNGNQPKFYRTVLRPTLLRSVMESLGECSSVELLDVSTELTLMREAVSHRVGLYSDLVEAHSLAAQTGQPEQVTQEMLISAGEVMRAGLADVVKAAEVCARVEKIKGEVASAYSAAMAGVITTVLQVMTEVFEDDHRVARVEMLLRESLRAKALPGADGTDLTPADDALEMDESVPKAPASSDAGAIPTPMSGAELNASIRERAHAREVPEESDAGEPDATFE